MNDVNMVEETMQNMEYGTFTLAELKRALPKQVNHNTLVEIVDYLDKSGKIYIGIRGITWTYNPKLENERKRWIALDDIK